MRVRVCADSHKSGGSGDWYGRVGQGERLLGDDEVCGDLGPIHSARWATWIKAGVNLEHQSRCYPGGLENTKGHIARIA